MFEALVSWIKGREASGASKDEVEAAADLLVWTMFADGHVATAEEETVESELRHMGWSSPYSLDLYLLGSVARARRSIADREAGDAYLASCAARIQDPAMQARVLEACTKIAASDGNTSARETDLLERIRAAFSG
jgi:uncharacterized tellurite resistance protein B-like protein